MTHLRKNFKKISVNLGQDSTVSHKKLCPHRRVSDLSLKLNDLQQ